MQNIKINILKQANPGLQTNELHTESIKCDVISECTRVPPPQCLNDTLRIAQLCRLSCWPNSETMTFIQ